MVDDLRLDPADARPGPAARTSAVAAAGLLLLALIGWVDYVTGVELRVFPLYFLPIALIAWRFGWLPGLLTALTSALTWLLANTAAGLAYSASYISVANTVVQLVAFATVAWLIAAQRDALDRERALSRNDALTGLLNVRGLHDRAAQEVARCRRTGAPLAIGLVDLDHFKAVNDTHGHAAGDRVLVEVAEALRQRFRAMDITARLGGDEFVVVMPETSADGARRALEDVRAAIARTAAERGHPVTASVGACVFHAVGSSFGEMLREADRVMYEAKGAGRDRVTVATVGEPPAVSPSARPSA